MRLWPRKRKTQQTVLTIRPGSTVKRDVYKAATAGVTGIAAFGALAVTGAVAGTAAHDQATKDQHVATQTVAKHRTYRTIVRTRVVHAVSTSGVTSTGSGGAVRSSSGGSGGSSSGATRTHTTPRPAAPAPAPSSGS